MEKDELQKQLRELQAVHDNLQVRCKELELSLPRLEAKLVEANRQVEFLMV